MNLPLDKILEGDVLKMLAQLPDESVDCIITSPPYYGLRDYGVAGQLGSEPTLERFLINMLLVTWELKRVLKKSGTMFWDHGDSYVTRPTGSMGENAELGGGRQTQLVAGAAKKKIKPGFGLIPKKSLLMQAHRLAIRMVDEQGWILRNQLIWHKPNAMPSSVKDRFGVDFEPIFFFSKSKKYHFEQQLEASTGRDFDAVFNMRVRDVARGKVASEQYKASEEEVRNADKKGRKLVDPNMGGGGSGFAGHSGNYRPDGSRIGVPGMRGKRAVWTIPTMPYRDAHFATFPEALIEPMILAGCPRGGVVLDPFMGAGTTAVVAKKNGRHYLGIELNPEYIAKAEARISRTQLPLL